jgi:hypothetical protein
VAHRPPFSEIEKKVSPPRNKNSISDTREKLAHVFAFLNIPSSDMRAQVIPHIVKPESCMKTDLTTGGLSLTKAL